MTSRVRACVVSYRSGERAVRACRSAVASGATVVVVDNSPGDGTAELLAEIVPEARVVVPGRNLGFAGGANLAAAGTIADYLLFLNPDAELDDGALSSLVRYLDEHAEAGIVGPRLRFPDGRPQPSVRRDPSARATLYQYTVWKYTGLFHGAYRRYRRPPELSAPAAVDVLMGSVLLVRRDLFVELGGFDGRYFMYYEEADLCRRAREHGAKVVFVPEAGAVHEGGASAGLAGTDLAATRLVSAQRYLRRFLPRGRYFLFRMAFLSGFPPRALIDLTRDLLYTLGYAMWPSRHDKVGTKAREALTAFRLLTGDLFRVVAA